MKQIVIFLFIILYFSNSNIFPQNPEWVVYNTANSGLPHNYVRLIEIDLEGHKWILTSTNIGLVKFDGAEWTVYNTSNSGLPSNSIEDILIDKFNNKWIGTYDRGLAKFNDQGWTVYNTSNSGLPSNDVTSLAIDNSGNKWIGTAKGGLAKFDGANWIVYDSTWMVNDSSDYFTLDNIISCLSIDNSENIWMGTYTQGLIKFDGTHWKKYNKNTTELPAGGIISMAVDKAGIIWLGTGDERWGWDGGGLVRFDENDSNMTIYNKLNSPLLSNVLEGITIDEAGNKWIAMMTANGEFDGGIAKIDADDTTWTIYSINNSELPCRSAYCISVDKYNNKWIGFFPWRAGVSLGGLAVFNEEGIVTNVKEQNMTETLPTKFILMQNYPNPFNPSTTIKYSIPSSTVMLNSFQHLDNSEIPKQVRDDNVNMILKVYDVLGREVATLLNKKHKPGNYEVNWDASNQPSGVYFYTLRTGDFTQTKKMVLLR